MPDLHDFYGPGYLFGFIPGNAFRFSGLYAAKTTGPGTDIAQDHECGRSLSPAFTHIGATATGTDRIQFIFVDQASQLGVILPDGQFYPQPFRFFKRQYNGIFSHKMNLNAKIQRKTEQSDRIKK